MRKIIIVAILIIPLLTHCQARKKFNKVFIKIIYENFDNLDDFSLKNDSGQKIIYIGYECNPSFVLKKNYKIPLKEYDIIFMPASVLFFSGTEKLILIHNCRFDKSGYFYFNFGFYLDNKLNYDYENENKILIPSKWL